MNAIIDLEEMLVISNRLIDQHKFSLRFLEKIFGVLNPRIGEYRKGRHTIYNWKLATYFSKLNEDKDMLSKVIRLFIEKPKRLTPRRRSKSLPRSFKYNSTNPFVIAATFAPNNPFLVDFVTLTKTAAVTKNPFLDSYATASTNPFLDSFSLPMTSLPAQHAPRAVTPEPDAMPPSFSVPSSLPMTSLPAQHAPRAVTPEPDVMPPSLSVPSSLPMTSLPVQHAVRAVTPEPDVMPPNYQTSTISTLLKTNTKLPVAKKKFRR